ncbi:MAG TPA: TrmH family RNA methyltransferase [Polyangiaceae bacterium]|jgi:tRNA G18 (ribose-2'-O)-methylase SpoU|nr:TrmH family RNA methyltransferase [Polyangiaceae bacterium]
MDVFLYAPEQFENLCVLARTLEVFGFRRCYLFDPRRLVRERYGKSYAQRLRTVSAGAFEKIEWLRVPDPGSFLGGHLGRRVATVPRREARSLFEFRFRHSDLLLIGAERAGLAPEILARCEEQITIPQFGVTESLNVAVASGIAIAEYKRQEALALLEAD